MKITRIAAYQVDLPLREGSYNWSGGKSVSVFDSTVVRIETDDGVTGFGEVCPLGPFYLASYAAGVRAGIAELAPDLIGLDPRELGLLNRRMDALLKGHPYVKSALDMACWDILGQAAGLPVCTLLGGRFGADTVLYRAISQAAPEAMAAKVAGYRAEGYRRFQLKVGAEPDEDIARIHAVAEKLEPGDVLVADANTGWLAHQALRVLRALKDVDVYIEQPCLTYEECLSVRRRCDHPFVLDGKVIGQCMKRHRHQEFIRFLNRIDRQTLPCLDIHLIIDNYAAHKTPEVKRWLKKHPRFHIHFTPTSASWLNMIERFFAEITRKRIRRGAFKSVAELEQAIYDYLAMHNQNPVPFVWTATAKAILKKTARAKQTLETVKAGTKC